jgi:hypothetical protein
MSSAVTTFCLGFMGDRNTSEPWLDDINTHGGQPYLCCLGRVQCRGLAGHSSRELGSLDTRVDSKRAR